MIVNLWNRRLTGLCVGIAVVSMVGCANFPWKEMDVEGPLLEESLAGGSQAGENEFGTFTEDGWQPGPEGSLIFTMPGMTQGLVEFDVTGLNRSVEDTVILTMVEEPPSEYLDPFIIHNPYKVLLTLNNFQDSPRSPFSFLWTAKNFGIGTPEDTIYSESIPENAYVEEVDSRQFPIFLNETYRIKVEWYNGVATMSIDDEVIARHQYRPVIYQPSALTVILGKTPTEKTFNLPDLTYSDLLITFPTYQ